MEHFAGIDGLRERGLTGVEFVVADDHAGLKASIREVLPEGKRHVTAALSGMSRRR